MFPLSDFTCIFCFQLPFIWSSEYYLSNKAIIHSIWFTNWNWIAWIIFIKQRFMIKVNIWLCHLRLLSGLDNYKLPSTFSPLLKDTTVCCVSLREIMAHRTCLYSNNEQIHVCTTLRHEIKFHVALGLKKYSQKL